MKISLTRTPANRFKIARLAIFGALAIGAPLAVTFAAAPMNASINAAYGQKAGQIADSLAAGAQKLALTDAQKVQIKTIAQKYAPQIRAVVTNTPLSTSQKREQLQTIRTAIETEVNAVLTPKQRAQVAAMRAVATQQITTLISQIAAQINLTDEQKANIRAILQNARFAAAAILTDDSASKGEKRGDLMALRNKTRADVAALLTPAQQSRAAAIANQIRPVLMQKAAAWRSSGGLGLGLVP